MARKAVAATLASVVLFTALVVADSTITVADDNLSSAAINSQVEVREQVLAVAMAGAVSVAVLAEIQSYLANPADCSTLPQYLAAASGAASLSGVDSGVKYIVNSTAAPAESVAISDNLSIVAPFDGGSPGRLNLRETLTVEAGGGSVDLAKRELHFLNFPISPGAASELCAVVASSLASALNPSCNSTLRAAAFGSAVGRLAGAAAVRGFDLTAGWGSAGTPCSATYWFTLVQPGVRGPTGDFDWAVRGSGTTA